MALPTRWWPIWLQRPSPALRYAAAVLSALAAQAMRQAFHAPRSIPFIMYVPFIVLGAAYGGFLPGLLTTALCLIESTIFASGRTGSFPTDSGVWLGPANLVFAGLIVSLLFEKIKRATWAGALSRELATLLEHTYDAVWVWELDSHRITFWNQAARRLYGYEDREVLGKSIHQLLVTTFPESLEACIAALHERGYWEGELVHTRRDGRSITVESRMSARRLDNGPLRVIEVTRDITERKRLEQTLMQLAREHADRERTLESLIHSSPACIALLRGPEFTFESVNAAYAALCPGETMVGRTVAEVWPDAAPLVLPLLKVVREAQTVYHATEARIPRRATPHGPVEERYFDFSYVPIQGPGADIRVLVSAVEVTRYKRTEAELRAANQELAAIYSSAPVALMVIDENLRVRKLNDFASCAAGGKLAETVGASLGNAIRCLDALADPRGCGDSPACTHCALRFAAIDTLRHGNSHQNVEAWLPVLAEGRPDRQCLLVSTTRLQFNGEKLALVCAHDITERKNAEEKLRQTIAERESALTEKTVLLKEVHHRVKNNLAVISSLLNMKSDADGSAEVKLALADSQRRVSSIALIHEYLYGTDRPDRIDFREYTGQLVESLHSTLAGPPRRVAIRLDVAPIEMGVHRAVPCALILNELVSNAFKHAFPDHRSGEVCVSLQESAPGHLDLVVEDNGIGSPPNLAERNGKSLGLTIVKILTKQLGGAFEQTSPAQGGTRFVIRFRAGTAKRCA